MWRGRNVVPPVLLAAVMLASASALEAQQGKGFLFREPRATVTLYGGFALANAGSDLFDFTTSQLTLDRGDFSGADLGGDFAVRISDRWDVAIGYARSSARARSESRDWVDENDQPIEQVTRFSRAPVTASVRFHPLPRGRTIGSFAWIPSSFDPWLSVGAGRMSYSFRQVGDFVDDSDPDNAVIFTDDLSAKGWANVLQASVGAGWSVAPRLLLTGEVRYLRSSAELDGDFFGFDRLDLSGVATTLGLSIRL
jgi:hypothetical protein